MACILAYHRVAEAQSDVHHLCVSAADFRAQMAYVKAEYDVVPLRDLIGMVKRGDVSPHVTALTFDDGYLDNYAAASPILTEFDLPATFFVTSDRLNARGRPYEYWWDALERIFLGPGPRLPERLDLKLPAGTLSLVTKCSTEYRQARSEIYRRLFSEPVDVREHAIDVLTNWSGRQLPPDPSHRRMNSAEVLALSQRAGHEIGAHTVRHLPLPEQPSFVQEAEMRDSRADLRALVGKPIPGLAYPFGAADNGTAAMARELFDYAVTCENAIVTEAANIYRLPRLEVRPNASVLFDEWLHGAQIRGVRL